VRHSVALSWVYRFRMMDRLVTTLDLEPEPAFGVQTLDRARAADVLT
jgi:hypothetical protein